MANAIPAPPGLIVVRYTAYFEPEGFAESKTEIEIELDKYPVVGFVWEGPKGRDIESTTTALYLDESGQVLEMERVPYDMEDDGLPIPLGVYQSDTSDESLVGKAKRRVIYRQEKLKRKAEREAPKA